MKTAIVVATCVAASIAAIAIANRFAPTRKLLGS